MARPGAIFNTGKLTMRTMIGLAAIVMLTASVACVSAVGGNNNIKGNGVIKEESRDVPTFDAVDIASAFEATLSIGPKASIVLELEENLLPLVKTEVKDGILSVNFVDNQNIQTSKPLKVTIVVTTLKSIAARGAAKVFATVGESSSLQIVAEGAAIAKIHRLNSAIIDVRADGASQVTLAGRGDRLDLKVAGAAKVLGDETTFESAKVSVDGASKVELRVTGAVQGSLSGASSLHVQGNPTSRKVKTSGTSKVTY